MTAVLLQLRTPHAAPWWRYADPRHLAGNLWRHRALIGQFVAREVRGRYQGSLLGWAWSLAVPALALATYTFVFGTVFGKTRWGGPAGASGLGFALTLLTGLVVFNFFSEVAQRAPGLVLGQPNFVKRVVFPVEILPVVAVLAALVQALLGLGVVGLVLAVSGAGPAAAWAWLPLVLVPYAGLLVGLAWLLAAVGTFFRDLGPAVAAGCQLLIFLTPVFYPLAAVPQRYQSLVLLNPLAIAVENARRALGGGSGGEAPQPLAVLGLAAAAGVIMLLGYACFMRAKPAMADVV